MRVAFFGYHAAGIKCVEILRRRWEPDMLVLTHRSPPGVPDLAGYCEHIGIPLIVSSLRRREVTRAVRAFCPDLLISVFYRARIPRGLLDLCPGKGMNCHPSPLPKYRGCFSSVWEIINGETESAVTYHLLEPEFDAGRITHQVRCPIFGTDRAYDLYWRKVAFAVEALPAAVELLLQGCTGTPQQGEPSYFPRRVPYGGFIDPTWSECKIERFIRAMYFPPYPPAKVRFQGQEFEVLTYEDYARVAATQAR